MEKIKPYFPFAFQAKADAIALVINIVVHLIIGAVAGVVFSILGSIDLIGVLFNIAGSVVGLYLTVSLILSILDYLKVLK